MAIEKISIEINGNLEDTEKQLEAIDKQLKKLNTMKVNVQLRAERLEETKKSIAALDVGIEKLQAQKAQVKISGEDADVVKKKMDGIQKSIDTLKAQKAKLQVETQQLKGADKELNDLNKEMQRLNGAKAKLQVHKEDLEKSETALGKLQSKLKQVGSSRTKINISSNIDKIGGQLDKLGSKMLSVFNPLKSKLGELAGAFSVFKLLDKAVNVVSSSVEGAVARFDTMNKFPKVMESLGYSTEQSTNAIKALSDGIDGLPTTLDEIVSVDQRITSITGDIEKATQSTIGLNNAFLASGADADATSRGIDQYIKILSKGKPELENWNTLMETMPVSLTKVANKMGYTGKSAMMDLYDAFKKGNVTVEQFQDTIIELGTGTGELAELAKLNSQGIKTSFGNLGNAVKKGVANMITKFDELSQKVTGKSIAQNLDGLKGIINSFFSWIGGKVDSLAPYAEKIKSVFKRIQDVAQNFDWSSFKEGFVGSFTDGLSTVKDGAKSLMDTLKPVFEFVKDKITDLGDGNFAKGLGKLPALFIKVAVGAKLLGKGLKVFSKLSNFKLPSLFGGKGKKEGGGLSFNFDAGKMLNQVKNLAMVYGVVKIIQELAQALKDINDKVPDDLSKLAPKMANMAIALVGMGALVAVAGKLAEKNPVAAVAGLLAVAAISVDIMLAAEAIKQINEKVPDDIGNFAKKMANIGIAIGGFGILASAVGALMATGIGALVEGIGLLTIAAIAADIMLVAEAIQQMNEKVPDDLSVVKTKIDSIAEVVGYFTDANLGNLTDVIENALGVIDVAVVTAGLKKMEALADELGKFSGITIPKGIKKKINKLESIIGEIDGAKLEELISHAIGTLDLRVLQDALIQLVDIGNKLKLLEGIEFNETETKAKITSLKDMAEFIGNDGGIFSELKKLIKNAIGSETFSIANDSLSYLIDIGNKLVELQGINFDYDKALTVVEDLKKIVNTIGGDGEFNKILSALESLGQLSIVNTAIDTLREIGNKISYFEELPFKYVETYTKINQLKAIVGLIGDTDFMKLLSAIGSLSELGTVSLAIDEMKRISEKLRGFAEENHKLKKASAKIEKVKALIVQMNDFPQASGFTGIVVMVDAFQNLLNQLSALSGDFEVIGSIYGKSLFAGFKSSNADKNILMVIESLITKLKAKTTKFNVIGKSYGTALRNAFTTAVKTMPNAIDAQITTMIGYSDKFANLGTTFGTSLVSKFNESFSKIGDAISRQIDSIQRKLDTLEMPSITYGPTYKSDGGEVEYRASGGIAGAFKPKGTDTVPAMLTPGEYVQSKKAVDKYGTDFMNSVNKRDTKGIFNHLVKGIDFRKELAALTGGYTSKKVIHAPVTNIINNVQNTSNNNNNARVTQNISGGSQNYSMRRASRYLGVRA